MKLDWRWQARFADGKVICQPPDDKYSKHDDSKDWNPSSYRDFLDYFDGGKKELLSFGIVNAEDNEVAIVRFDWKEPYIFTYHDGDDRVKIVHDGPEGLSDLQPIYYREMQNTVIDGKFGEPKVVAYNIGYQGKDKSGKNVKYIHRVPVV